MIQTNEEKYTRRGCMFLCMITPLIGIVTFIIPFVNKPGIIYMLMSSKITESNVF